MQGSEVIVGWAWVGEVVAAVPQDGRRPERVRLPDDISLLRAPVISDRCDVDELGGPKTSSLLRV